MREAVALRTSDEQQPIWVLLDDHPISALRCHQLETVKERQADMGPVMSFIYPFIAMTKSKHHFSLYAERFWSRERR